MNRIRSQFRTIKSESPLYERCNVCMSRILVLPVSPKLVSEYGETWARLGQVLAASASAEYIVAERKDHERQNNRHPKCHQDLQSVVAGRLACNRFINIKNQVTTIQCRYREQVQQPTAVDKTAINQTKLCTPCEAIAPDVSAIPIGPDILQVLMAPVTICHNPDNDPKITSLV